MVGPSSQFTQLSNRIYTFGFLAFALKILPIKSVKFQDAELTFDQKSAVIGLLALLALLLTIAAAVCLARDSVQAAQARHLEDSGDSGEGLEELKHAKDGSEGTFERLSSWYLGLSAVVLFIQSVIPILFGTFISIVTLADLYHFLQYSLKVLTSGAVYGNI